MTFNINEYISVDNLKKYESFVKLFSEKEREIIAKYSIPQHEYVFITKKEGKYYVTDKENIEAILFIKKKYYSEILEKYFSVKSESTIVQKPINNYCLRNIQKRSVSKINLLSVKTKLLLSKKILPKIILAEEEKIKIGNISYGPDLRGERSIEKIFMQLKQSYCC